MEMLINLGIFIAGIIVFIVLLVFAIRHYKRQNRKRSICFLSAATIHGIAFTWAFYGLWFGLSLYFQEGTLRSFVSSIHEAQKEYRDDITRGAGEYASSLAELQFTNEYHRVVGGEMIVLGSPGYYVITTNKDYTQAVTAVENANWCLFRKWHADGRMEVTHCSETSDR